MLDGGWVTMVSAAGLLAVPTAVKPTTPTPDTTASTRFSPGLGPRVHRAEVRPASSVVLFWGETLPPPVLTTQVTPAPETPFPLASTRRTTRSPGSSVPVWAVWPFPDSIQRPAALPAVAV